MKPRANLLLHVEAFALLVVITFTWARHVSPWLTLACSVFAGWHTRPVLRALIDVIWPPSLTRAEALGGSLGALILNSIADRVEAKSLTVDDAQTAIRCAASVLERGERAARKGSPS